MSFADTYLSRYASRRVKELPLPDKNLILSVVIPVFNEPELLKSLNSLLNVDSPGVPWEIILVVNEPEGCRPDHHHQNQETLKELDNLASLNIDREFKIHILTPFPFPRKKAGPGMARKIGMDESIRRFNFLDRPEGIIVSLDADTFCSPDYLKALTGFYQEFPDSGGCTVYFEHKMDEGRDFDSVSHNAIVQYELYLRYFKLALEWMTFPYANYALGSAFSITAGRYVNAGGMGLQQAGEDFYFLQKCIPLGNFYELNTTAVYPSARTSDRVIFGTGPFIARFIEDGKVDLEVFSFEIFSILKPLFAWVDSLKEFPDSLYDIDEIIAGLPGGIRTRMIQLGWDKKIYEAFKESAGIVSFKKRFYHEISLLQIIRLFNELSLDEYPKTPVRLELQKLLPDIGCDCESTNPIKLLETVRGHEKLKAISRIS